MPGQRQLTFVPMGRGRATRFGSILLKIWHYPRWLGPSNLCYWTDYFGTYIGHSLGSNRSRGVLNTHRQEYGILYMLINMHIF
jgi:hypothetical protein